MLNAELQFLASDWLLAKQAEAEATDKRRAIEDKMREMARIAADLDGTETVDTEHYQVKVTGRIDRKVDGDKLQELAAEAGLSDHLGALFRWKPEINMTAWKQADESITRPLAGAITAKPGRPSFKIIVKE